MFFLHIPFDFCSFFNIFQGLIIFLTKKEGKSMTKADIVEKVAAGTGLTKLETEAIVEGFSQMKTDLD